MSLAEAWEQHAPEWISWARAPGHDGFWDGTWPELLAVLPKPDGLAVEIGCGEGRASRQLMAAGYDVVAVEQSTTMARAGVSGDPPVAVARGDAAALPFRTGCAALVVACMVFQDVDDLGGTVREVSRVLRPGGHLCFAIVHPFGSAQDDEPRRSGTKATVSAPYLAERINVDRIERDGFAMTFVSAHRPLVASGPRCK
jgi:SAM-dependent methyltransferase